jgi:Flp pilus assembly protein TadG
MGSLSRSLARIAQIVCTFVPYAACKEVGIWRPSSADHEGSGKDFKADESGAVALIFGLALLPMLLRVGAAIDYSYATATKVAVDAATDQAALVAVSRSELFTDAAAAKAAALNAFNRQTEGLARTTVDSISVDVSDASSRRSVSVSYQARTSTAFLGLAGITSVRLAGSAAANSSDPQYIDFYLLLDNTPSMGVGATPADVSTLVNNTSDQCAFACHDLSTAPNDYYSLAKKLGVTMRIDVVRSATQALMDTASVTEGPYSQFRMAIYTFGSSASSTGLTTISPLTSNLANAKAAASAIDLMAVPYQGYNNDQITDFNAILAAANSAIPAAGTGSMAAPQKVLFLVSDGVNDSYNASTCSQPTTGGRCQAPIDIAQCTAMKDRGVKIAVLYTTYLPLPTNGWYNSWIAPFSNQIAPAMQSCASPGLFFEVSPTQGIPDAMSALFKLAVGQAALTH